jgi:hypothetical protein
MGHQIVIWQGPRPDSDAAASDTCRDLLRRYQVGERASFLIAEVAEERDLVTFDTYVETLRPCPKRVIDDWNRRVWAQVLAHPSS